MLDRYQFYGSVRPRYDEVLVPLADDEVDGVLREHGETVSCGYFRLVAVAAQGVRATVFLRSQFEDCVS